ncbi:HET-domain-containing protein [Podospora australis]|uniref:HET-domain-containing protein n=1 Tax=Podospora australis TaxID=1536484 RepID=A0AAN6WII2_9PEZI|nr:HET-domain-containing protein [Podospora australis]
MQSEHQYGETQALWQCEVNLSSDKSRRITAQVSPSICPRCEFLRASLLQFANTLKNRPSDQFAGEIVFDESRVDCGPCQILQWARTWLIADGDLNEQGHFLLRWSGQNEPFYFIGHEKRDNFQGHWLLNGSYPLSSAWNSKTMKLMKLFGVGPDFSCPWGLLPTNSIQMTEQIPDASTFLDRSEHSSFSGTAKWIDHCIKSHDPKTCPKPTTDSTLPTRLVDIGSDKAHVKLVETNVSDIKGPYTCLSHCWGGYQPLRTTKETLTQHLSSIPWDGMPKTFQDAIEFNRHLGVQYIWIDSLCIIQDDRDDWARESAAMCAVYQNSYLTVSASSASDGTCGLSLQASGDFLRITLPHVSQTIFGHRVYSHPATKRYTPGYKDFPLFDRAWAFQERLISPRIVHFLKKEIAWECGELTTCECGAMETTGKQAYSKAIQEADNAALVNEWHRVVEVYSDLTLSFPSDRLPALSGLARQMASKRGSEPTYLAGLWKDSVELDLLWYIEPSWINRPRSDTGATELQAPSWSWVGIQGKRVTYQRGRGIRSIYFSVLDVQTMKDSVDPFGAVSGGVLTLSGHLFDVMPTGRPRSLSLQVSSTSDVVHSLEYVTNRAKPPRYGYHPDHFKAEEAFKQPGNVEMKALRMARIRTIMPTGSIFDFEFAMVLLKCDDTGLPDGEPLWQRVGMVVQTRKHFLDEDAKPLTKAEQDKIDPWVERPSIFPDGGIPATVKIA